MAFAISHRAMRWRQRQSYGCVLHPPAHCSISDLMGMMRLHFTPVACTSDPHEFVNMIWPVNKDLSERREKTHVMKIAHSVLICQLFSLLIKHTFIGSCPSLISVWPHKTTAVWFEMPVKRSFKCAHSGRVKCHLALATSLYSTRGGWVVSGRWSMGAFLRSWVGHLVWGNHWSLNWREI